MKNGQPNSDRIQSEAITVQVFSQPWVSAHNSQQYRCPHPPCLAWIWGGRSDYFSLVQPTGNKKNAAMLTGFCLRLGTCDSRACDVLQVKIKGSFIPCPLSCIGKCRLTQCKDIISNYFLCALFTLKHCIEVACRVLHLTACECNTLQCIKLTKSDTKA